jgi:hypothetical protein
LHLPFLEGDLIPSLFTSSSPNATLGGNARRLKGNTMPVRTSTMCQGAVGPVFSLVALLSAGASALALTGACTKKKDKGGDSATQDPISLSTPSTVPSVSPSARGTPSTSPTTTGENITEGGVVPEGTTGSGTTLPKAELGLSPAKVEPFLNEAAVNANVDDLSRLNYLFELTPPSPKALAPSLSDLESKTESCVRSALQATRFETATGGFKLTTAFDFKKCVEESKPNRSNDATREWTANVQWAMRARCDNHDFKQYDGLPVSHPDVMRYLCHDATAGEIYAHVRFEAQELDVNKKLLRKYLRTRAFAGRTKETCAFVLVDGKRKYGDCVALDRIDNAASTLRYLEVSYPENQVMVSYDDKGQKFTQSKVNVVANDWKGDVQFPADTGVKGTYQLSNGTQQVKQTNAYPWPSEFETPSQLFKGTAPQGTGTPAADTPQQQQQQQSASPTPDSGQVQQQSTP